MTTYGGAANPYRDILELKKVDVSPARWAIRKAFMELYQEIPFSEISVKKLCERAHVARTTFYANYSNTDALLEEIEDALIVELLDVTDRPKYADEKEFGIFGKNLRQFIDSHTLALTALLVKQPDLRLINKWKRGIKYHFWALIFEGEHTSNKEFTLEIIASMAVSSYTFLLENPDHRPDQKEITELMLRCFRAIEY